MKYIIKCDIEKEIEANDDYEAMELFYSELAEANDCLENHTKIEYCKEEVLDDIEKQILDKEGEEALQRYQGNIK